jgi:hypothetical protein
MAMRRIRPVAWEFLHDASEPSLESFELSRLNNAANLRREIAALLDQWIEDTSQAMLARWVRKERAAPRELAADDHDLNGSELPFNELPAPGEPPKRAERPLKLARRNGRISSAC